MRPHPFVPSILVSLALGCSTPSPPAPDASVQAVLDRHAPKSTLDRLQGTWALDPSAGDRRRWQAWQRGEEAVGRWLAEHPGHPEGTRLSAAVDTIAATQLVVEGTTLTVKGPSGASRATFLVEGETLDEAGRTVLHLATTRDDGLQDRLDLTFVGLDGLLLNRRTHDDPPTGWKRVDQVGSGAP